MRCNLLLVVCLGCRQYECSNFWNGICAQCAAAQPEPPAQAAGSGDATALNIAAPPPLPPPSSTASGPISAPDVPISKTGPGSTVAVAPTTLADAAGSTDATALNIYLAERRQYRLDYDGEANVKEWGAVGDGLADDTAAFEAAIKAVVNNAAGGALVVPAGTFALQKRLVIEPQKPFVIRGLAPDLSKLTWSGNQTEGIAVITNGTADPYMNDALVSVTGVSLVCTSEGRAKSSGLLIAGEASIAPLASGKERLGFRGVTRIRVATVSIRGAWAYGLVLRSAHLAEVETVNIAGVGPGMGSAAGLLMNGAGAPTGHTFENLRVFFFRTGVLLKSDVNAGRIEGVKIHNSNIVAVQTGVRAESVLELSMVQNHINCQKIGVMAINADQCFFQANLIYQNNGQGHGIHIQGANKIATSHVVTGNIIVGVQASTRLYGVTLDSKVSGVNVANNILLRQAAGLHRPPAATGLFSYVNFYGNIARGVNTTVDVPQGPGIVLQPLEEFSIGE